LKGGCRSFPVIAWSDWEKDIIPLPEYSVTRPRFEPRTSRILLALRILLAGGTDDWTGSVQLSNDVFWYLAVLSLWVLLMDSSLIVRPLASQTSNSCDTSCNLPIGRIVLEVMTNKYASGTANKQVTVTSHGQVVKSLRKEKFISLTAHV